MAPQVPNPQRHRWGDWWALDVPGQGESLQVGPPAPFSSPRGLSVPHPKALGGGGLTWARLRSAASSEALGCITGSTAWLQAFPSGAQWLVRFSCPCAGSGRINGSTQILSPAPLRHGFRGQPPVSGAPTLASTTCSSSLKPPLPPHAAPPAHCLQCP